MEEPVPARQDIDENRTTVLLVEDEFLLRWPAAEFLRDAGHRVIEAATVDEAVALLSSVRVDIVFSDINLAGTLSGHELAGWMGEHHPELPLLLTSGETDARALTSGTSTTRSFLAKPYDLAQVGQRIQDMLARK